MSKQNKFFVYWDDETLTLYDNGEAYDDDALWEMNIENVYFAGNTKDGNVYFIENAILYVIDKDGETIFTFEFENNANSIEIISISRSKEILIVREGWDGDYYVFNIKELCLISKISKIFKDPIVNFSKNNEIRFWKNNSTNSRIILESYPQSSNKTGKVESLLGIMDIKGNIIQIGRNNLKKKIVNKILYDILKIDFYSPLIRFETIKKYFKNNNIKISNTDLINLIEKMEHKIRVEFNSSKKRINNIVEKKNIESLSKYESLLGKFKILNGFDVNHGWEFINAIEKDLMSSFNKKTKEENIDAFKLYTQKESVKIYNKIIRLIKRCSEDEARKKNKLPLVGEEWISETEMFCILKAMFPCKIVRRNAHVSWLGRQHLDVYIPALKLAFEYMGKQHYEAIDFFGGEDAFIKNQERDKRKDGLCKKNGINLIKIKYTTQITRENLIKSIPNSLKNIHKNIESNNLNADVIIPEKDYLDDISDIYKELISYAVKNYKKMIKKGEGDLFKMSKNNNTYYKAIGMIYDKKINKAIKIMKKLGNFPLMGCGLYRFGESLIEEGYYNDGIYFLKKAMEVSWYQKKKIEEKMTKKMLKDICKVKL